MQALRQEIRSNQMQAAGSALPTPDDEKWTNAPTSTHSIASTVRDEHGSSIRKMDVDTEANSPNTGPEIPPMWLQALAEKASLAQSAEPPHPIPTPLSFCAFGLTLFVYSVFNTSLLDQDTAIVALPLALWSGGIIQILAGMWEFQVGDTFGATAHCSYGAFWLSYATLYSYIMPIFPALGATNNQIAQAVGVYYLGWTIFSFFMMIGSFRKSVAIAVVYVLLVIQFILVTAGTLAESANTVKAGGYFGIFSAAAAWYVSAATLANITWHRQLFPLGKFEPPAQPGAPKSNGPPARVWPNPSPLALSCFALTTFVDSVGNTTLIDPSVTDITLPLSLWYGGVVQVIAGLWEFRIGNTFGGCVASFYGGFWLSYTSLSYSTLANLVAGGASVYQIQQAVGVFILAWTIMVLLMTVSAYRVSKLLFAIFIFVLLAFVTDAAAEFGNSTRCQKASGYFGIIAAFIAWYMAAGLIIMDGYGQMYLPLFLDPLVLQHLAAANGNGANNKTITPTSSSSSLTDIPTGRGAFAMSSIQLMRTNKQ